MKSQFRKKSHHVTRNGLHIVLATGDNKSSDFIANQLIVMRGNLILNTVQALDHFKV
ncbi:hypothetical protein D3C86_1981610 [compost metagenome]